MRLKWDASPWLLAPVPLLAAPATVLWGAALFGTVGLGPAPFDPNALMRIGAPAAGARLGFLLLFLGLPAIGFAFAFFGTVGGEIIIEDWTIAVRLRLPRPRWRAVDLIGAALLVVTALLTLAVAAHLVGD